MHSQLQLNKQLHVHGIATYIWVLSVPILEVICIAAVYSLLDQSSDYRQPLLKQYNLQDAELGGTRAHAPTNLMSCSQEFSFSSQNVSFWFIACMHAPTLLSKFSCPCQDNKSLCGGIETRPYSQLVVKRNKESGLLAWPNYGTVLITSSVTGQLAICICRWQYSLSYYDISEATMFRSS